MLRNLRALWNIPARLERLSNEIHSTDCAIQECLYNFSQFMATARRLDEANPDRRAESDRIGAAALAKMLAEDAVRRKQEGRS